MKLRFAVVLTVFATVLLASGAAAQSAPVVVAGIDSLAATVTGTAGNPNMLIVRIAGPTTGDLLRARGWKGGPALDSVGEARLDEAIAQVATSQKAARRAIERSGARIISTYDAAMNGFLVEATPEEAAVFASAPGVVGVGPAPYFEPLLEDAVPQIGAIEVANNLHFTGKNVTIAVIDTGVDYTHKSLGGSGRVQDYDKARLNPSRAEGLFPNDKVIGGYDFAGTSYTGSNTPVADEDPIDENGHGSHVSGITAGMTGNSKLHHGVARDALILGLKVFGRTGGTNVAQDAVEWAIEVNQRGRVPEGQGVCRMDPCRVDVINMSLGAGFAQLLSEYGDVFTNATRAGVVVVASAGNDRDVGWVTGAPAADPNVLSVASVWPTNETGDAVLAHYGAEGSAVDESLESVEALEDLAPQISSMDDIQAQLGWFGRGCAGDRQEGDVTGRIALIQRGSCEFKIKIDAAAAAGARAAIIFSDGREITPMGTTSGKTTLVAFMIQTDDGERLRDMIVDGVPVEATLSKTMKGVYPRDYVADVISGFSSRGPGRNDVFKPNIAGVGSQINAPLVGSGDRGTKLDGTSMSGPTVAGAAAVLVERLRADGMAPAGPLTGDEGLGALDVATLLVNGAHSTVYDTSNTSGKPVALARGGAGRVDLSISTRLETEVRAGTRAPDSDGTPFGIYFGFPAFDDIYTDDRAFFVRNASTEPREYRVAVHFPFADDAASGVTFSPSEDSFQLAAGEVKDLALELRADPSRMKRYAAYGGDMANVSAGLTDAEHDAYVTVTEVGSSGAPVAGGDVSRLPVYVLPKPASVIEFDELPLAISAKGGATVNKVTNLGAGGVLDLFVPAGQDDPDTNLDGVIDIDHVGARIVTDEEGERTIEVLVQNKGIRNMPLDTRVFVGIDTDRNGSVDYMAIAQDVAYWPPPECNNAAATFSGIMGVVVSRVSSQNPLSWSCTGTIRYLAGVDQHSSATILPILPADLGYSDNQPIAFDLVVFHAGFLPGSTTTGKPDFDGAPNDGILAIGGNIGLGPGRFHFTAGAAGVRADPWSNTIPGRAKTAVNLTRTSPDSTLGQLLAYHRYGLPGKDIEVLTVEERIVYDSSVYLPALKNEAARD